MTFPYKFDRDCDIEVHHPLGGGPYWARIIERETDVVVVDRVESTAPSVDAACRELELKARDVLAARPRKPKKKN
ncbi:MAG TPA: hypothetical protein VGM39_16780 [Kofleriaceae bacterium]|jgi:hypothetical protein